ncbi:uncharacterized protein LOC129002709 [Macrosteles quadrilineatus]|uniref:uncharacterized protein LOC129002709 n=1 Tax=Macrosteles quadrilineatus TaxID=74068 RepID=UPI0023E0C3BC|nr:uncharacterized protein LOC129002709 [Macrosteles quadrilineatus]
MKTPKDLDTFSEISDSTVANSLTCMDVHDKSALSGASNREYCKNILLRPRASLSQYLESKSLKRNLTGEKKKRPCVPTKKKNLTGKPSFRPTKVDWEHRIRGGGDITHRSVEDKVNLQAARAAAGEGGSSDHQMFPFKTTPSGNFKLKPSQIVYESKDLSIVAADPASVSLNITESEMANHKELEKDKKPFVDNWTTTCLYTAVGTGGLAYSDFDTSDSDRGPQVSELSLAKMGYVIDNCIDWNDFTLPKKSDLKEILFHNILNMINPDIQVKTGSKVFKCHRIVLQSYSSFFASKTSSQIELSESVSSETFPLIYQWMLHPNTDSYKLLRRDNILKMFKAAQYLGIKELEEQCWSFIDNMEIFCEDKAFLLYLEARKMNNKAVMELMVPRVQRFFLTLVSSKEFIEFNSKEVCTFLQSNYICVHCEEEVFMSGVRWLLHDWEHRKVYAIEIMACVRFGLMSPKVLLSIRKHKGSPEFQPIINIPDVGRMVDDGLSIKMLKMCHTNESSESIEIYKQKFDLEDPAPRNWAGTERCYQSYEEFVRDLSYYRSKQRLEVKQSRMKIQMEKVDKDNFLSSAVLPPETQQKIRLQLANGTHMDCLPQKEPKEQKFCYNLPEREGKNAALFPDNRNPYHSEYRGQLIYLQNKYNLRNTNKTHYEPSFKEKDDAARKIQKAYRQYSSRKLSSALMDDAARKIQKAYRQYSSRKLSKDVYCDMKMSKNVPRQARSDPSLPSRLIRSSTHFSGKNVDNQLPLRLEKETVFLFGGKTPYANDPWESSILFYHPEYNEWRRCGVMPEPIHYHSITYFQERIYIAGGRHPSKHESEPGAVSRKVWRYDPHYKTWTRIKDMLQARQNFGLVGCNNRLYAIGGRNEKEIAMSKVERFDSGSNSWVSVAPMHVPRAGAVVSEFRGKIWVAGGVILRRSTSSEWTEIATNRVEYYDWEQNMWFECSTLRFTLAYGVMVPTNNKIYIVGGAIGLQNSSLRGSGKQIDVWDEQSRLWGNADTMGKPRHNHTAVSIRESQGNSKYMFIMGGLNTQHECALDTVECWNIEEGKWIIGVASLPSPIFGSAALVLPRRTFS